MYTLLEKSGKLVLCLESILPHLINTNSITPEGISFSFLKKTTIKIPPYLNRVYINLFIFTLIRLKYIKLQFFIGKH